MAKQNGNGANGNGNEAAPQETLPVPSLEELRRAYKEGLEQTLLSGIKVKMHPVSPDRLLQLGNVPDMLTPIMLKGLYGDITADLNDFVMKKRDEKEETLEMIRAVNVVCEAALVEPDIVPYLSLSDRMWIFKLAFMPVEVLSRFRLQPRRDVGVTPDEQGQPHASERDAAVDRVAEPTEPVDSVPIR